jgi:hypothetical protein
MQDEKDLAAAVLFCFFAVVIFVAGCKSRERFIPTAKGKSLESKMIEDYIQLRRMIMNSSPGHGRVYEDLIRQFKNKYIGSVDYAILAAHVGELFSCNRNSNPVLISQPVCN